MLQPMQPMGQSAGQKPGQNIAAPRNPGQQTMPAGAAFQRGILPGGIASNPEDIKAAYGGTPQGQQKLQQAAQQGDYLSAIALSQILEEERERAAAKAMPQEGQGKPEPVVDRMRNEAVELRRQDLEEQQAKRLGMENQRSQQAMAQMVGQAARPPMQGVAGLPAPNVAQPRAMAAGGIIAFEEGGDVERKPSEQEVRSVGADPYAGMSRRQIIDKAGRELIGMNQEEAARRAREEYVKHAGFTPEEKAAREKRIAETEAYDRAMYDPTKLQNEGLAAFLMGAANTGGIGETFARAGQSGLNYSNKMRELARQRMMDRQKQAEEFEDAQRGVRGKGFEVGQAAGLGALKARESGLKEFTDLEQAEIQAASARASRGSPEDQMYLKVLQRLDADQVYKEMAKKLAMLDPESDEFKQQMQRLEDYKTTEMMKGGVKYQPHQYYTAKPPEPEGDGILSGMWDAAKALVGKSKYQQQTTPPPPPGFKPVAT
jgi:hypothetical protein